MKSSREQDKYIVEGILKGDEQCLRTLYAEYKPRLAGYIKRKIANPQDAEELLQDTLMASLEALRDFTFSSSLYTYICSIANHKVIDFYRKKKIKNILFSQLPEIETLLATFKTPEEDLDEVMLKNSIQNALKKLSPQYRKILLLKYIHGYSVGEIAQKMSLTFKSAESQLFRARKAFVLVYV